MNSEAADAFAKAACLQPRDARVHEQLAACLLRLSRLAECEDVCRRLITIEPMNAKHYARLGAVLARRSELSASRSFYQRAVEMEPGYARYRVELAVVCNASGDSRGAAAEAEAALRIEPGCRGAHFELGTALYRMRRVVAAAACLSDGVRRFGDDPRLHAMLAESELHQMRQESAIEHLRSAVRLLPGSPGYVTRFLQALNYAGEIDEASVFREHRDWGQTAAAMSAAQECPARPRAVGSPLRVAYLSADLRDHPVPYFLEPILGNHDHAAVTPIVLSDVARPDQITDRLRRLVTDWIDIAGKTDDEVIQLVRDSQIDLLVDLAGHTARNRLSVFAHGAAPVQVTYLGYPNTTGLPRDVMQFRLTDGLCDPPGRSDELHTEQLFRLPAPFLCYRPPSDAPDVSPLPALSRGYVTFGCFNSMVKITRAVLRWWSSILQRVAQSRLLLKNKALRDPDLCRLIRSEMGAFGVGAERVILLSYERSVAGHLARYSDVDIALDTFPYHGTTTTCDALWMGVPVVSLAGEAHRSRVGLSLLNAVGLGDLVADSPEDYIKRATALAEDMGRLAEIRADLRARVEQSPLRDEVGFTRNLEKAFAKMWEQGAA